MSFSNGDCVHSDRPRLLVSVRNAREAAAALAGGAEIIDVKEPSLGSLGRASAEAVDSIARALTAASHSAADVALSIALGEVTEWQADQSTNFQFPVVVAGINPQFLKLGLSGLATGSAPWRDAWYSARSLFAGGHAWVAVAYADHHRAAAPEVEDVCDAAAECGCRVLLIDTFVKDRSTLFDWLTMKRLKDLKAATRSTGLRLALAGRVTERELSRLISVGPDIIGVRTAVCDQEDRKASVSLERVRQFRTAIDRAAASHTATDTSDINGVAPGR